MEQKYVATFFYWSGFAAEGMPPQPIWLDIGDGTCSFSIGMPNNPDPMATGTCAPSNMTQV